MNISSLSIMVNACRPFGGRVMNVDPARACIAENRQRLSTSDPDPKFPGAFFVAGATDEGARMWCQPEFCTDLQHSILFK
jgi:hypothetical protein